MTEYRKVRPEEWEDCIELINYVFSISNGPHDFEKILPKVYQAGPQMAAIHRAAVDDRGRLRAMIAVLPQTLVAGGRRLQAGYVGSVSVHPKARGEGHMKRLLSDWLEELTPQYDLLVLDGQRQRYGYFGFEPGSMRYVFELDEANVRHALKGQETQRITFEPLFREEQADRAASQGGTRAEHRERTEGADNRERAGFAARLNESKLSYVVREPEHIQAVLATFGQTALAVCVDGVAAGYLLCAGERRITEAVFPDNVSAGAVLGAYLLWKKQESLEIFVPVYERKNVTELAALAEEWRLERCGLGLYRILNYANVLEAYLRVQAAAGQLTPGVFSAVLEGQPVTARYDGQNVLVSREASEDALILSRREAQELLLSFTAEQGGRAGLSAEEWNAKVPRGWFPLPVFWSMADEF